MHEEREVAFARRPDPGFLALGEFIAGDDGGGRFASDRGAVAMAGAGAGAVGDDVEVFGEGAPDGVVHYEEGAGVV